MTIFCFGIIEILVDRFVTDMQAWMLQRKPSRDNLRRLAYDQLLMDIGTNRLIAEPRPTTGLLPALIAAKLRPTRCVASIFGGGVPVQLSRDRGLVPAESLGNVAGPFAFIVQLG